MTGWQRTRKLVCQARRFCYLARWLARNHRSGVFAVHVVGVFEAKNKLTALLNEVESGQEVLITRRGKPVARLVPAHAGLNREKAQRAADGLRALSKGLSLGEYTIKDLVGEGRR